jgi:hypothetical protein
VIYQVQTLTLDTMSPRLRRFVIDRSTKRLHMSFNEAINKTSLQVSENLYLNYYYFDQVDLILIACAILQS